MLAAFIYVAGDEPGNGGDAGVKRPEGFMRVTVVAGGAEAGADGLRWFCGRNNIIFYRRIRARRVEQLKGGENYERSQKN